MTITSLYAANGGKPNFVPFVSHIGILVHLYHDKPQLDTTDSKPPKPIIDPDTGIQKATYKATLMWPKAELKTALIPMRELGASVVTEAWGPEALADPWLNLQPFLRDGDNPEHNTAKKEYLFGHVYLNFKQKAKAEKRSDGSVAYSGGPQLIGPRQEDLLPVDIYPGCRARVSGIMFGTEYSGKRFISTRLNNIQRDVLPPSGQFERIGGGGGRPDARSQFDALETGPTLSPSNPFAGLGNAFGAAPPRNIL